MLDYLKKNKFLAVLVACLFVALVFYIYDSNKGKVQAKTSNGEDVVMEVAGTDYTASAFYDEMYKNGAGDALGKAFARGVVERSFETTDEMKNLAKERKADVLGNYSSSTGDYSIDSLNRELHTLGYNGTDELEAYLINYDKEQRLIEDYITKNFDDLKIRNISYILIRPEETSSDNSEVVEETASENSEVQEKKEPTEDEQKRMDAVDEMLKSGKTFAETAKEHSEDTSTASTGGVLGTLDKNTTNIDEEFLKAALALKQGETSEWVHSENFGYFKIYCNADTKETIMSFYKEQAEAAANESKKSSGESGETGATSETVEQVPVTDPVFEEVFADLIENYDHSITNQAIWEKGKELGVTFSSEDVETAIKNNLGVK